MSTVRITTTPAGFKAALKALGGKFPEAAIRAQRDVGLRLSGDLIQKQIQATDPIPVDMGQYKASWSSHNTPTGAVVGNNSKQAVFVEIGRKPGSMPPLEPLLGWAKRHGFVKWARVAAAIQHKIFRVGITGRKVLITTLLRNEAKMAATFRASIKEMFK